MLLLLHALIPCLGAYNSSSVLLHINIVSYSLCCCIYIHTLARSKALWACRPPDTSKASTRGGERGILKKKADSENRVDQHL